MARDRSKDEATVGEILMRLGASFRELDTAPLKGIYADDADWTNAFGTSRTGAAEIIAYLQELYADEHFGAGKPVGPPQASMRFVGDDVVVVKTYIEREGQETADGEQLGVRRNHSLKVLQRQEDDRWLIVSDIYMDARDEQTFTQGGNA